MEPLPEPVARPFFIFLSGLPGTGKSYLSKRLAQKLPCVVIESDAMRKVLFPQPTYTPQESAKLFRLLYLLIKELLERNIGVILDATNLIERHRERFYALASRTNAKLLVIRTEAPPEVVRERLEMRKKDPENKSDADWEVYLRMKSVEEKIRHQHFTVDTTKDITPFVEKIAREVRKSWSC